MHLLNSPPGAIPNSFVRCADIESRRRYITPWMFYRVTVTITITTGTRKHKSVIFFWKSWMQTWTVPWLLRISRDFSMSKFCASSRIVASSRCWHCQSQNKFRQKNTDIIKIYQDVCPAFAQLHHHNVRLDCLEEDSCWKLITIME